MTPSKFNEITFVMETPQANLRMMVLPKAELPLSLNFSIQPFVTIKAFVGSLISFTVTKCLTFNLLGYFRSSNSPVSHEASCSTTAIYFTFVLLVSLVISYSGEEIICFSYNKVAELKLLIMPRAKNVHAIVNAGFLFNLSSDGNGTVVTRPNIVYGGINPSFVHATATESYLNGKCLFTQETLNGLMNSLEQEIQPDHVLPDMAPNYRKGLTKSLIYKVGEAEYINDRPLIPGELFGAFVKTTIGNGTILSIDPSDALSVPGVVKFYGAEDIPGKNSVIPYPTTFTLEKEERESVATFAKRRVENHPLFTRPGSNSDLPIFGSLVHCESSLFCSGKVLYWGQPVGIIVAVTRELANKAASKVKIEYSNVSKPVIHLSEVIDNEHETWRIIGDHQKNTRDNREESNSGRG
uniref:Uncharacterized protein n=1 Tax=Timema cristinae TaxID=61476 RepID=A0A7R9CNK1_TIMCR|nr:unnamed protein product [Timema cristinae]